MRTTDIACRYGGEELAVIMPGLDLQAGRRACERIAERIGSLAIPWNGEVIRLTISAGVAQYQRDLGGTRKSFTETVDHLLYRAKALGRNRVIAGEPSSGSRNSTRRILLIDDNQEVGRVEKRLLERLGHQVELHHQSNAGLEAFRRRPERYRLMITDINMPELDGFQLAQAVRAIKPGFRVILATGEALPEPSEETGVAPRDILLKPFTRKELKRTLREG